MAATPPDPSFLALAQEVVQCTDARGADILIESLHRAAWKFNLTYSAFDLPYPSSNPVGPAEKGKVEEVARFLTKAFRSWCPMRDLTQDQLERLNSSLLLMQPAFGSAGFAVQSLIAEELENLETGQRNLLGG